MYVTMMLYDHMLSLLTNGMSGCAKKVRRKRDEKEERTKVNLTILFGIREKGEK